jgi:hypothetical protein
MTRLTISARPCHEGEEGPPSLVSTDDDDNGDDSSDDGEPPVGRCRLTPS